MITLSESERHKFGDWLVEQAQANDQLAQQMDKIPGTAIAAQKYRKDAAAMIVVAQLLGHIHEDSV